MTCASRFRRKVNYSKCPRVRVAAVYPCKASALVASARRRSPQRPASRDDRWRRPDWCASHDRGYPCDRKVPGAHSGRFRFPADSPIGQLGENHRSQMVVSTKRSGRSWHRKARRGAGHFRSVQAGHDLGEDRRGVVHLRAAMARNTPSWSSSKTPCLRRYSMVLGTMRNSTQPLTGQL